MNGEEKRSQRLLFRFMPKFAAERGNFEQKARFSCRRRTKGYVKSTRSAVEGKGANGSFSFGYAEIRRRAWEFGAESAFLVPKAYKGTSRAREAR